MTYFCKVAWPPPIYCTCKNACLSHLLSSPDRNLVILTLISSKTRTRSSYARSNTQRMGLGVLWGKFVHAKGLLVFRLVAFDCKWFLFKRRAGRSVRLFVNWSFKAPTGIVSPHLLFFRFSWFQPPWYTHRASAPPPPRFPFSDLR